MNKNWSIEKSKEIFSKAINVLPSGCTSSIRGYPVYDPHPIYIVSGLGSKISDVDGNDYVDYINSMGAIILGHCNSKITDAVINQIKLGTMFGTTNELEVKVAEKIKSLVPSAEMIRFACSGNDAVMYAVRTARAYTGKNFIIKFEGHYHGYSDSISVNFQTTPEQWEDSGPSPIVPMTPGIVPDSMKYTIPLPWNNIELLEKTIKENGNEIAAVITEPIMCNGGLVFPNPDFIKSLRKITEENNIVLIFDEVITGFRVAKGGASEFLGVKPDLHTFAKALANGYPLAAFGGKAKIMKIIKPGGIFHGGTYSGNPLSLAAAYANLTELTKLGEKGYEQFYKIGNYLIDGLKKEAEKLNLPFHIPGFAGFSVMHFTKNKKLSDWRSVTTSIDKEKFTKFAWKMYKRGFYFHPDPIGRIIPSFSHTYENVDNTVKNSGEVFKEII